VIDGVFKTADQVAQKTLDKLLAAQGVDIDSVVADFKAVRRKPGTPAKKLKTKAA
jgi:hypothetical protein